MTADKAPQHHHAHHAPGPAAHEGHSCGHPQATGGSTGGNATRTAPLHAHAHGGSGWRAAASVTTHCLTGCLVGEWLGLAIGVVFALPTAATVALATVLAYVSGFALTLWPLLRGGTALAHAVRVVFVGEAISIGVMELVMNAVDYSMGGMAVKSLMAARYWEALAVAAVAGFLAAWPVNVWLLSRNLKSCH
ncbi:MAG TPA: DUF4396 domain-containing protein [Candidatus Binatia bacterium]|nr:DUF4396 domain-containing protein [Candidatus Binatia bacterium]